MGLHKRYESHDAHNAKANDELQRFKAELSNDMSSVGEMTRLENNSLAFNGDVENSRVLGDDSDDDPNKKSDSEEGKAYIYMVNHTSFIVFHLQFLDFLHEKIKRKPLTNYIYFKR